MNTLDEIKAKRFRFIEHIYRDTEASTTKFVRDSDVGDDLGFNAEETNRISRYLKDEGLLDWVSMQGLIRITHEGIKRVEEALSAPEKPTEYFPAVNVINIGHMEHSQIQQATMESTQTYIVSEDHQKQLSDFISRLKKTVSELQLSEADRNELEADIVTVETQVSCGKPKTSIIKASLLSIRNILEGAAGAVVAGELLKYLPALLALL